MAALLVAGAPGRRIPTSDGCPAGGHGPPDRGLARVGARQDLDRLVPQAGGGLEASYRSPLPQDPAAGRRGPRAPGRGPAFEDGT
jgi:hypothetical protein